MAKEFAGQFECLGANTEKKKTFLVPIEKEINKDGKDDKYNLQNKIHW